METPSKLLNTEVIDGGTKSMSTGRYVDNGHHPRLDKNIGF
jgi:hypothetical protein